MNCVLKSYNFDEFILNETLAYQVFFVLLELKLKSNKY